MDTTNQLDDYLAGMSRAMRGLPESRVLQETDEVRAHIRQIIEQRRQEGMSEQEALVSAVDQFGAADVVGKKLKASWLRANPLARGHFALGLICSLILHRLWLSQMTRVTSTFILCLGDLRHFSQGWLIVLLAVAELVVSFGYFSTGWVTTLISPKRSSLAVAIAYLGYVLMELPYLQAGLVLHGTTWLVSLGMTIAECLVAVGGAALCRKWLLRRARRLV